MNDPRRPPPASAIGAAAAYRTRLADGGFGYYCPAFGCLQTSSYRTKCPTHDCEMTPDVDPHAA